MPREIAYSESVYLEIEKKYGCQLPSDFHLMWKQGWMSLVFPVDVNVFAQPGCNYMCMPDMEWHPLEDILSFEFPDYCRPVLPNLIPFAFNGAGDNWCFQADHNMRILLCPHDDQNGEIYAPDLKTALFLQSLVTAASIQNIERGILKRNSIDLALIFPERWCQILRELSEGPTIQYQSKWDTHESLLSPTEFDRLVKEEVAYPDYMTRIRWMGLTD